MKRHLRIILELGVAFFFLSVSYVNCSRTYGIDNTEISNLGDSDLDPLGDETSSSSPNSDDSNRGVKGGHFDLDTAIFVPEINKKSYTHHVHEYDDKFDVTKVDFFNFLSSGFTPITKQIKPGQVFLIVIANSELSPGATLKINNQVVDLVQYRQQLANFVNGSGSLPTFTLDGNGAPALTELSVEFDVDSIINDQLIATSPQCVFNNDPGKNSEYRNGAFTVQLVDKNTAKFNPKTKSAAVDGGMLWESMVYWHKHRAPCN